jgi:hydroxyacylglutathione hydrolase
MRQILYLLLITLQALGSMKVQTFNVGMLSTNCYVASCAKTKEAIIIDPGFDRAREEEQIIRYVAANTLDVKFIVNTHGHSDHISGDSVLKKQYGVPVCIHAYDAPCLNELGKAISPPDVLLEDEGFLKFGRLALRVMHTPGHSLGSISLVGEKLVFTGETLFAGGIGRTDFEGSSDRDMRRSLEKLLRLPDTYVVYPGHGAISTIGKEKRFNPFLRWL